jgi:diguanylate cyclase (GGDEF)-like protein
MSVQSINFLVLLLLITHVLGFQIAKQTISYRAELFSFFQQKESELNEMDQLAKHDGLTGLINRRHFFELLNKEYQRFMRLREPFCILILDIDDFKKINDKYGHAAGDEVLRKISKALLENARTMDVVSRVGGEEFAVLCPGLDVKDAFSIGERTRIICENVSLKVDKKLVSVTTSIGITEVHQSDNDIEGIMRRADVALYSAKSNGKNQVVMSEFNLKPKSGNESYQLFGG